VPGGRATDLRQVFDDLVRFETILWGAVDGRLQEECGIGLASLNGMLVADALSTLRRSVWPHLRRVSGR
jgi:hypothetical protein